MSNFVYKGIISGTSKNLIMISEDNQYKPGDTVILKLDKGEKIARVISKLENFNDQKSNSNIPFSKIVRKATSKELKIDLENLSDAEAALNVSK